MRAWAEQVWECPAGPALTALMGCRPARPTAVGLRYQLVPGEPVAPRSGDDAAAFRTYRTDPAFSNARRTPEQTAAEAHNARIQDAEFWWANALVDSLHARQRQISALHAEQAADVAELSAHYPGLLTQLPGEVGMALRITDAEAGAFVDLGQRLTHDLPATMHALSTGTIALDVATAIHQATSTVTEEVAAEVESRIIPEAGGLTRRQTYRRCQQLIALLDPKDAADRHRTARKRRGVWRELCADGMARMTLFGPAHDVATIWTATHLIGDAAYTAGDDRTPTQRRFDALKDVTEDILHTGTWQPSPSAGGVGEGDRPGATCDHHAETIDAVGGFSGVQQLTDQTTDSIAAITGPISGCDGSDLDSADAQTTEASDPQVPYTGEVTDANKDTAANTDTDSASGTVAGTTLTSGTVTGTGSCCDINRPAVSPSASRKHRTRSPILINVHVTMDTLTGRSDTPGWIDGCGAIDADTTRLLAGDATWRRILTDPLSGTVLDVGRTRYRPPAALTEHIQLRDMTCRRPGCDQPAQLCDIDHEIPYHPGRPTGGPTDHRHLRALCRHDHLAKDGGGCHLTQNHDESWTWTTALGRSYTRPRGTIFDPGDDQPSSPEYYSNRPIPLWARRITEPTAVTATADEPPF